MATREQKIEERRAEVEYERQMRTQRDAERAEQQSEHDELAARVQARHDAIDAHIRRQWAQMEDRPMSQAEYAAARNKIEQEAYAQFKADAPLSLDAIYDAKRAEELARAEQAEQARRASLSPHDVWLTTLNWTDRQRIEKWEAINHMPWPGSPA